jgi:hypothetical protein
VRLALAFLACCFALNQGVARSAEIKATPIPGLLDTAMVTLRGEIESSDTEQFRAAVATYPKAIVAFQSPGGSLIAEGSAWRATSWGHCPMRRPLDLSAPPNAFDDITPPPAYCGR